MIESYPTRWILVAVCAIAGQAEADQPWARTIGGEKPQPIVAIPNICAWPNLTMMGDGTVVAAVFGKPCDRQKEGDVQCWASADGGRTWQQRGTPAPHEEPNSTRKNLAAGLAANGDLIVICAGLWNYYQPDLSVPWRVLPCWVSRSVDGGRTWTIDKEVFPSKGPDGGPCIPFGDIVRGHDETLRVSVYTVKHDRSGLGVFVYRSEDDGRTWGRPVAIDRTGSCNETALLHLGGGKWLAASRTYLYHHDKDGQVRNVQLYASADDGRTWVHRMGLSPSYCHPGHLLLLRDGRILLSYGNRTKRPGVEVRYSNDEGITWSESRRLSQIGGYPSSVQLADGQLLTAYYTADSECHMGVVLWAAEKRGE